MNNLSRQTKFENWAQDVKKRENYKMTPEKVISTSTQTLRLNEKSVM